MDPPAARYASPHVMRSAVGAHRVCGEGPAGALTQSSAVSLPCKLRCIGVWQVRLLEVGLDDDGRQRVRIGQDCWCSAEHSDGSPGFESCSGPGDDSTDSDDRIGDAAAQTEADARRRLIAVGEEQSVSRSRQAEFDAWTRDYEDGMRFDEDLKRERPFPDSRPRSSSPSRQPASDSVSRKAPRKPDDKRSPARKGRRSRSLRHPAATKASAGRKQAMAERSAAAQEQQERDR